MADVKQTWSGDVSQLEKEIVKLQKQQVKLDEQIAKTGKTAAAVHDKQVKLGSQIEGYTERSIRGIGNLAFKYTSVLGVLGLITKEIEHQDALEAKRRQASMTIGQAQAGMVANLGMGVSEADTKAYALKVQALAAVHGIDPVIMAQAASSALAGSGSDQAKSLAALNATAPAFRADPSQLAEFVQFVPGMADAIGGTMEEGAALMASMRSQNRTIQASAFKHAASAIASNAVVQQGSNADAATAATAALYAGIGQTLQDAEGAASKTGVMKLAAVLEQVVGDDKTLTTLDQLNKVRADPQLQEKVMKLVGQNEYTSVIGDLMDPNSKTSMAVDKALPNIKSSVEDYEQYVHNLNYGSPQLEAATMARGNEAEQMVRDSTGGFDAERKAAFDRGVDRSPSWFGISRMIDKQAYAITEGKASFDALQARLDYYAPGGVAAPGREVLVADLRASIADMQAAEAAKIRSEASTRELLQMIEENTRPSGPDNRGAAQRRVNDEAR